MSSNIDGGDGGVGGRKRFRVMVVDDYPDAAEITCVLLRILGHDGRAVHRGDVALEVAEEFCPDIAIVDLGLPDMSGIDVGRALRQRARRALHLAALTGWTDQKLRGSTYEAGFDQFLLKPTTKSVLESILAKASGAVRASLPRSGGPTECRSTVF